MDELNQIQAAVILASTVAGAVGIALGYYLEDMVTWTMKRIVAWRDRKDRELLEARIRGVWNLSDRQARLAVTAHERWSEGRCPFCGYDHREGAHPRCEAQVAYVREVGLTTWEDGDLDRLLDHIFGEDRRLEAVR